MSDEPVDAAHGNEDDGEADGGDAGHAVGDGGVDEAQPDRIEAWIADARTDPAAAVRAALDDDADLVLELAARRLAGPPDGGAAWWERTLLGLTDAGLARGDLDALKRSVNGFAAQARDVAETRAAREARRRDLAGVEDRDGAAIAADLHNYFSGYLDFTTPEQPDTLVLWSVHAHCLPSFDTSPRLDINSADKRAGKTRLLELLELVVPCPLRTVGITPAALFRSVGGREDADNAKARLAAKEATGMPLTLGELLGALAVDDDLQRRTVLVDEVDTIFGPRARSSHEDLRGLINAGYRRGATVPRIVGGRVKEHPVFAAVALCGIGRLPDTIADRAITITLRRSPSKPRRLRFRNVRPEATRLRRQLAVWADNRRGILEEAQPEVPEELDSRAAECWEPLIAIADVIGGDWPERARRAAVALSAVEDDDSLGRRLLADIRAVFTDAGVERIRTEELLERLNRTAPWATFGKGGTPLHAFGLHHLLRSYGIANGTIRLARSGPGATAKGFMKSWFTTAWAEQLGQDDATSDADQPADGAA